MASSSSNTQPLSQQLMFKQTPQGLLDLAQASVDRMRRTQQSICSTITKEQATFDNVLLPLALVGNESLATASYIGLFWAVSTDPEVRTASKDALKITHKGDLEVSSSEDMFRLIEAVWQRKPQLDPECQRYLEKKRQGCLRNGLALQPGSERERLKELKVEIERCRGQFMQNLGEMHDTWWLTKQELDGLPPTTMDGLESSADGRNVCLKFKTPDVRAILNSVHSGATRKKVYLASVNVAKRNVPIFRECLLLRDEMAKLLGYRHFVEYIFVDRMAESKDSVDAFLDDLHSHLYPLAVKDAARLSQMKAADMKSKIDSASKEDQKFWTWDINYYLQRLQQEEYHVDQAKISEYFPAEVAIKAMLDNFEKLFGIVVKEDEKDLFPEGFTWLPEVRRFNIWNEEALGGEFLGYLYTDIYPRDGKYGHNANFNVSPSWTNEDGTRHYAHTALICNLTRPTPNKPSLLTHRQVITLFHELGHGMFDILSQTRFGRFSGNSGARDFLEMPSQMLEYWCWIPSTLQTMSRHYSYLSPEYRETWLKENPNNDLPPETIPTEMVNSLIRAKNVGQPLEQTRQIAMAKFDITIYGQESRSALENLDIATVFNKSRADLEPVSGPETLGMGYDWSHPYVNSSHFIWGNEACYYNYLYSRVFSADLFAMFFEGDPMNREMGRRYRKMVLEKGSGQDEMKTLREFLGREVDGEGFRREMGI